MAPGLVVSPLVVGGLWAAAGLAGGLGALFAGHLRTDCRERLFVVAGTLATAVAIYPLGELRPGGPGARPGARRLRGGPAHVGVLSLRQRRTDPAWLGRGLAVSMSFNVSGLPIGSASGGFVVAYSPALAFALAALASVLAAAAAYGLVPAHDSGEHADAKS
jgi:hypothetical protein